MMAEKPPARWRSALTQVADLAAAALLPAALFTMACGNRGLGLLVALIPVGWAAIRVSHRAASGATAHDGAEAIDQGLADLENGLAHRGRQRTIGDVARSLYPSLDLGTSGMPQHRRDARDEILAVLPTVERPTYEALPTEDKVALIVLAELTDMPAVALELLALFEQAEDTLALAAVRRMAGGECPTAGDARVTEAARRCLPVLEEADRRQREAATLLRPADGAPTDTLLRPAGGAPTEPADGQQTE